MKIASKTILVIIALAMVWTITAVARPVLTAEQIAARQAQLEETMAAIMPPMPDGSLSSSRMTQNSSMSMFSSESESPTPTAAEPPTPPPVGNYVMVDLGTLGGVNSYGMAINASGHVAGHSTLFDGSTHAFLYANGSMRDLDVLSGGSSSFAYGINDSDQVVGYSSTALAIHGFLFSGNGPMQDVNDLVSSSGGAVLQRVYSINNSGQMDCQGYYTSPVNRHGFLYSSGSIQDIGKINPAPLTGTKGINNVGHIVGQGRFLDAEGSTKIHAFLYSNGTMIDIDSANQAISRATAINDYEQITGSRSIEVVDATDVTNYYQHAFLYRDGTMQDIGTLGGNASQANGINNYGQIIGVATTAGDVETHPFLYSAGTMYDLNSLIVAFGSGWSFTPNGINDAGQIVGTAVDTSGNAHAAVLKPLPAGVVDNIGSTVPVQPIYGNLTKEEGKDSLVVITHGWIPKWKNPVESMSWVDTMSNAVVHYLADHHLTNWQVVGYKWQSGASTTFASSALNNAKSEGLAIGSLIGVQQGWTNVHLIGHSAGAELIQSATEWIKLLSPNTVVHSTFLDPFAGIDLAGKQNYGYKADWSENYFTRDILTGGDVLPLTEMINIHSYNVNVTQLDVQNRKQVKYFVSGNGGSCYKTKSVHGWPVDFYMNTITNNNVSSDYGVFGFPLSSEGGGFDQAKANYQVGNGVVYGDVVNLGVPDPDCFVDLAPVSNYPQGAVDILNLPSTKSVTGIIEKYQQGGLVLKSGSPAWVAIFVTLTNSVNTVSFDSEFQSNSGSEGMLQVFWDTDVIGTLDERAVGPDIQRYTLTFPRGTTGSTHMLGFRLDPFTATQSVITLTNITTSSIGVDQPFSLSPITNTVSSLNVFRLTGQPGFEYSIQATTNLVSTNWTTIAVLQNTNGTVDFYDEDSPNYDTRFYRAVAQ